VPPSLETTLPWWLAGPAIGALIVALLGLGNKRFGVLGGVANIVTGSSEGQGLVSWRVLLLLGMAIGALAYRLAAGAPARFRGSPGAVHPRSRCAVTTDQRDRRIQWP
jgi:hypothetical protein